MTASEDALQARLRTLRNSHLNLSSAPSSPQPAAPTTPSPLASKPSPSSPTSTIDQALAARFRALTPSATSTPQKSSVSESYDFPAEEDTPHNDEDEQTLEELLEQLGPDEQWTLDPEDPAHIRLLLEEARGALPSVENNGDGNEEVEGVKRDLEGAAEESRREVDIEVQRQQGGVERVEEGEDQGEKKTEDQRDEEEADGYIEKVLAQLDLERKYGGGSPDVPSDDDKGDGKKTESGSRAQNEDGGLSLPSAPTELPSSPAQEPGSDDHEDIDAALSARFASLGGLGLPSAPAFNPSNKPVNITKSLKTNLPKYTDDDIDTWCCICNEDATVRCLGCDGDLYCDGCWNDGHGTGPGQERGHRAVQYSRDQKREASVGV